MILDNIREYDTVFPDITYNDNKKLNSVANCKVKDYGIIEQLNLSSKSYDNLIKFASEIFENRNSVYINAKPRFKRQLGRHISLITHYLGNNFISSSHNDYEKFLNGIKNISSATELIKKGYRILPNPSNEPILDNKDIRITPIDGVTLKQHDWVSQKSEICNILRIMYSYLAPTYPDYNLLIKISVLKNISESGLLLPQNFHY
jgi:hypothetical protein